MQTNQYEFQATIANRIIAGETTEDIRKDLMARRQELQHLAGENPSLNEYKKTVVKAVQQYTDDFAKAKRVGPLAEAQLTLWHREAELAGRIVRGLSALQPECLDDLTDIRAALGPINQKIDRENLQEGDLLLGGQFASEIEGLYGVKDEEPAPEEDAESKS